MLSILRSTPFSKDLIVINNELQLATVDCQSSARTRDRRPYLYVVVEYSNDTKSSLE